MQDNHLIDKGSMWLSSSILFVLAVLHDKAPRPAGKAPLDAGALLYQLQRSLGRIQGAVYNEATLRRSIPMPSAITITRTPAKRYRSMAGPNASPVHCAA